ncbi:MAG: pentapeptide repeat-containing protein [Caldilineaceae bacterium]
MLTWIRPIRRCRSHRCHLDTGGSHWPDLRAVILNNARLIGVDLWGANLQGAELVGANLAGANLVGANLAGAKLSIDVVAGTSALTNLREADLRGFV